MEWFFTGLQFVGGVVALGVGAAALALFVDFVRSAKLREPMGFAQVHPALVLIGVTLYAFVALLLLAGVVILIAQVIALPFDVSDADTRSEFLFYILRLAGLVTVLGAVIALPFTIIRLRLTQKQTDTATEGLLNDKINAATESLYARRQVTKWTRKEGHKDVWEDDIVQRCAAIDRLEGLAKDNPAEIPRIARMLSVFVRELSKEVPPVDMPEDVPVDEIRDSADALPALRSDLEKAAQTLGRLTRYAKENGSPLHGGEVDLRGANLQRADLRGLDFEKARFEGARLQGAVLIDARLQGASLGEARLQRAKLRGAQLQRADLKSAHLQGADLLGAHLQWADLVEAQLQGADLYSAYLEGADLEWADLEDVQW
ncbi:MAG: pentapeptide repeat-containing protein [Pseudomonadota bacterium]